MMIEAVTRMIEEEANKFGKVLDGVWPDSATRKKPYQQELMLDFGRGYCIHVTVRETHVSIKDFADGRADVIRS